MNHKIIVIGQSSVGKTSWLNKILHNKYDDSYVPSLSYNQYPITYKNINMSCIDIPGNNVNKCIIENYHTDVSGIFIMDDVNDNLENVKKWKSELEIGLNKHIPIILVINKLDVDSDNDIDYESFSKKNNFNSFSAISVKDEYNLYGPFDQMINILNQTIVEPYISDNKLLFIRELMIMAKECNDNLCAFKIGCIILYHDKRFYYQAEIKKLVKELNIIILKTETLEEIVNYILKNE